MAITWRDVAAPDQRAAMGFAALGANQVSAGIQGLTDLAQNIAKQDLDEFNRTKELNTTGVLDIINSTDSAEELTQLKESGNLTETLRKNFGSAVDTSAILQGINNREASIKQSELNDLQFQVSKNTLQQQVDAKDNQQFANQFNAYLLNSETDKAAQLLKSKDGSNSIDVAPFYAALKAKELEPLVQQVESLIATGQYDAANRLMAENPQIPNLLGYKSQIEQFQTNDAQQNASRLQAEQYRKSIADQNKRTRLDAVYTGYIPNRTEDNYTELWGTISKQLTEAGASPQEIQAYRSLYHSSFMEDIKGNPVILASNQAAIEYETDAAQQKVDNLKAEIKAYNANNPYSTTNMQKTRSMDMQKVASVALEKAPSGTYLSSDIGGMDLVNQLYVLSQQKVVEQVDANGRVTYRKAKPTDPPERQYPIEPWMILDALQRSYDTNPADSWTDPEVEYDKLRNRAYQLAVVSNKEIAATKAQNALYASQLEEANIELNRLKTLRASGKEYMTMGRRKSLLDSLKSAIGL